MTCASYCIKVFIFGMKDLFQLCLLQNRRRFLDDYFSVNVLFFAKFLSICFPDRCCQSINILIRMKIDELIISINS